MRRARLVLVGAAAAATAMSLAACGSGDAGATSAVTPAASSTNTSSAATADTDSGAAANRQTGKTDGSDAAMACVGGSLTSAGSTAQQNAMTQWIKDYQTACPDTTITYGGGGSGQGITDFSNKQVDFAGSDAALDPSKDEVEKATKACGSPAINLPMVTGPIAVAYNLPGVDNLTLTPTLLANIFLGKITSWDDPAIAAANPKADLPATEIAVFNRSDQSGTTENFERYLAASAPKVWTAEPSKQWAGAGQGKKGNQLVGQAVQSTDGAIAYVEWSYAIQNNLAEAKIDNGAGPVALTAKTVAKAVSSAEVAPSGPGDLTLKLNYASKTPGAYPIILVTYEIVCTDYADDDTGALVKSFMQFVSSTAAQNSVHDLGYAALPGSVQAKVAAQVAKIK